MKNNFKFSFIHAFYLADLILVVILLLSFIPDFEKKNTYVDSSVLNARYVSGISKIEVSVIKDGRRDDVILDKVNGVWLGSASYDAFKSVFPCDESTVNNMIDVASRIVRMYKKTNKEEHWEALGVDEANAARVYFYGEDGAICSELYYGITDPVTQRLCVRSKSSDYVYETENNIETYLNTSVSFWADPFLFPRCVTGYSRKESESLLRRGQISYSPLGNELKILNNYSKTFENESKVNFTFYENIDGTIFVLPSFTVGPSVSQGVYDAVSKIRYSYTISRWTYEQLISN